MTPRNDRPGGGNFWDDNNKALALILGAICAMVGGPVLYQNTARYFLDLAAQNYPQDLLPIIDLVWLILMHGVVFFAARSAFYTALTALTTYGVYRFAF
jgi:hypothetical protein